MSRLADNYRPAITRPINSIILVAGFNYPEDSSLLGCVYLFDQLRGTFEMDDGSRCEHNDISILGISCRTTCL